jgi:protein-S-isoprenylcysteine O-methyltransferase Ste14
MNVFLIPFEEKAMEDVFGDQYVEYKKSVRRWI